MKNIIIISILIMFNGASIIGVTCAEDTKAVMPDRVISKSEVELRLTMRKLWESNTTLMRNYIVAEIKDHKDVEEAREKLLKNAGDLGVSIQPYYGYWARAALTGFLKKDVALTSEVIKAAKRGKKKDMDWAKKKWYANAFLLAGFLSIPNNQDMKDLKDMLYKHLDLVMGEIEAMLGEDGAKDLDYYERDRAHMLMFSDVLTDGIIEQFPYKFKE